MSIIIKNLNDIKLLESTSISLSIGDEIEFNCEDKTLIYIISSNIIGIYLLIKEMTTLNGYIYKMGPEQNDRIFIELGLNKKKFYYSQHGCEIPGGTWPYVEVENISILTDIIKAFYIEIEKKKLKKEEIKVNKFELLDFSA